MRFEGGGAGLLSSMVGRSAAIVLCGSENGLHCGFLLPSGREEQYLRQLSLQVPYLSSSWAATALRHGTKNAADCDRGVHLTRKEAR